MKVSKEEYTKWKKIVIDSSFLDDIIEGRNLTEGTRETYIMALTSYCLCHEMTLEELYQEADNEEEKQIRIQKRKLLKRLKRFRAWLVKKGYAKATILGRLDRVKTFYHENGIEIPRLPRIKLKDKEQEMFYDVPNLRHIKEAFDSTNALNSKALFLFCASSGTARNETSKITVKDFITATEKYHDGETDIYKVITKLERKQEEGIVPLFELTRAKTDYRYYTCCSPETVDAIIKYLKSKDEISDEDLLFGLRRGGVAKAFRRVNDRLNWGKRGTFNFFRSHKLRKFNANALDNENLANAIQGRKRNAVYEAYFKNDPDKIREEYEKVMDKVMINKIGLLYAKKDEIYKELDETIQQKTATINKLANDLNELQEYVRQLKDPDRIYSEVDLTVEVGNYAKENKIKFTPSIQELVFTKIGEDYNKITQDGVDTEYIKRLFDYAENTLKLNPNYFSVEEKRKMEEDEKKSQESVEFTMGIYKKIYEYLHKNEIYLTKEQKDKLTDFISGYSKEVFNFESKNIDKEYIKDILSQIIRGVTPKPYFSPNRLK